MTHASVKPVRRHDGDALLRATVVRRVAFRARCGDHWRGPSRKTWRAAQLDARQHNADEHA